MTFLEAYEYAMKHSRTFALHDARVKLAKEGECTACLLFSIGDESFAYGFDGFKLHKVKHNKKRSAFLISRGMTLEIRE